MDDDYLVILFDSTNGAIRAEQVAIDAGFEVRLIPTPRYISTDCGVVLRIRERDRDGVLKEFRARKVDHNEVVRARPK